MSGKWRQFLLAVVLVAAFPFASSAEEAPAGIDPSLVIEQFDVFDNGDALLVPVNVFGKTRLFVADSGCNLTVYDASLRQLLGPPIKNVAASTPSGATRIELFNAPHATFGKFDLQTETLVACLDLAKFRAVAGFEIEGFVGMDFLRRCIFHVDADAGKLLFLRAIPAHSKQIQVPITYRGGRPHVMLDGPLFEEQPFLIDTGSIGMQSGTIDSMTFTKNVAHGKSTELPSSLSIDARSTRSVKKAIFKNASIGGHECRELIMQESAEQRALSLRFLTRFNATFDFPMNMLYLEKSRYFDRPDRFDLSGLHFVRRNGQVVIEVVDDGSPAALGGIKARDILVSVNGDDASKARLFEMRETLSLLGTTVHVKLERGDKIVEVDLELPEKKEAKREVVELQEPGVFSAK